MKYLLLSILLIPAISLLGQASETVEVQETIQELFDGMRAGDSTKVHRVFKDEVRMLSVYTNKKGEERSQEGKLSDFLKGVGTPHDAIWDERIGNLSIKVDGRLAQAWVPYHFYLGDHFSHCGVNTFQLIKEAGHWKIINLTDTRRTKDCPSLN
ncbi:MAG: nuclear transport factor 2 family protein [Saprospiraceae bacterium]